MPDLVTSIHELVDRPDCELLPAESVPAVWIALVVCHNLQVPLRVCQLNVPGEVPHMLAEMGLS